jgi:hypothetical protein
MGNCPSSCVSRLMGPPIEQFQLRNLGTVSAAKPRKAFYQAAYYNVRMISLQRRMVMDTLLQQQQGCFFIAGQRTVG